MTCDGVVSSSGAAIAKEKVEFGFKALVLVRCRFACKNNNNNNIGGAQLQVVSDRL